ncbi:AAA family ATPase [Actinocorallia aurea]
MQPAALVGGYAGSGKTEFARFLSDLTGWTILDKDALTRRMTERLLTSLGGDPHDRRTALYATEVRPVEYQCLLSAARTNVEAGIPLILAAPFLEELQDPSWLARLTNQSAAYGCDVTAIWVQSDPDTMHDHLEHRDAPRDGWKLANWDEYTSALNTDDSPPSTHITVDNRHGAAVSLAEQTRRALQRLTA